MFRWALGRSGLKAVAVAVVLVAISLALRVLGRGFLGEDSPFLFFFGALTLAAWYGGFVPGAVATVLGSAAVACSSLLPFRLHGGGLDYPHMLEHLFFLAAGLLVSVLMERFHRTERELESRVEERTAELTAEKNKLMGILDQMPEAVYIVNPQYGVEYVNPAMEREFGPVGNQTCYEYTCGPGSGVCSWCRNPQIFDGKSFYTEWVSPKSNKVYDTFESPILLNGVTCKLKIMHDLTAVKRTEEALIAQHREIQQLSGELLRAQETERLRISREMHDELGQSLTLVKLKVDLIEAGLTAGAEPLKQYSLDASAELAQAIENMRRIMRDLAPASLETLGVTRALQALADNLDKAGSIRIQAEIDQVDDLLPLNSAILLYRILQEGCNNAFKHSGADTLCFSLKKNSDRIVFDLKDNGKGFDVPQSSSAGFGLALMRERARMLGGALEIESHPGKGTRLYFTIPIPEGGTIP